MTRPPWYEVYSAACLSLLWVGFWPPAVSLLRHRAPVPENGEPSRVEVTKPAFRNRVIGNGGAWGVADCPEAASDAARRHHPRRARAGM